MTTEKLLEWAGAMLGIAGSALLAAKIGWGFAAFLTSNLLWIAFGLKQRTWGLLTMQGFFTATSVAGLVNWR